MTQKIRYYEYKNIEKTDDRHCLADARRVVGM